METDLDAARLHEAGGPRYQEAHRQPGRVAAGTERSRPTSGGTEPDQQQRADDHGGPGPDDAARLQDQGYPKLGRGSHARLTQVEHGPYAGGTQQGGAESPERA